ncbi:MAG: nitroreductase family protein [Bryobacteraceae bacterium]
MNTNAKPASTLLPIHPLIRERWSPRAFTDQQVPSGKIRLLLEAARWAPSSSNEQPWSFLIANRGTDPEGHASLLSCLVPGNAVWAHRAPVLILAVARLAFERNGRDNRHALYDTGQSVALLSVQATALGLAVHQMAGFDGTKAREVFAIPEGYDPVAAIAIGYPGGPELLTEPLQKRETAPRERRPVTAWAFGSHWQKPWEGGSE